MRDRTTWQARAALVILAVANGTAAGAAMADEPTSVAARFNDANRPERFGPPGWDLRASADLRGGYDSNVGRTTSNETGSAEVSLRGGLDAVHDFGPHRLSLGASGSVTHYAENSSGTPHALALNAGLELELAPTLRLRASLAPSISREPVAANGIVVDGVFRNYDSFPEAHRLPATAELDFDHGPFNARLVAASTGTSYDPLRTSTGLVVPQDFRSGWEHEVSARFSYRLYPGLASFVEGRLEADRYDAAAADTDQQSVRAGTSFEFSRLLTGEIYAGYAQEDLAAASDTSGFIYGTSLTWFASPLVSLTLAADRSFRADITTSAGGSFTAQPATTDRLELTAEWEPLREMLVTLGSSWMRDETRNGNREDTLWGVSLRTQYVLTRRLQLLFDVEHQTGESTIVGNLSRDRVSLGIAASY